MNKRSTLVVSLAAALTFSGALYGVASAAETPTPPIPPTCGQAITDVLNYHGVTDAQHVLDTSGFADQIKSLTDGPPGQLSLAALEQVKAAAIAKDNVDNATVDSQATKDAKAAVDARTAQIKAVQDKLDAANKALVDAKLKLSVLVKVRDRVCAPKTGATGDPGATGAPGAPGQLVPVPVPGAPAPVVTNPQITVVPDTSAGVNTGDGSLA
jgi:hypothetical protein